jgi:hypothetical protein
MLLVYSDNDSPRLRYVLNELFKRRIGIDYSLTNDWQHFTGQNKPRLNYSSKALPGVLQITPVQLLFETIIRNQKIDVSNHQLWQKVFFVSSSAAEIPFDILAASFYLLSRYEEYTDFEPDKHGRFNYKSSLAWQHHFLETPLIDAWADHLKQLLQSHYPDLSFQTVTFQHISTIDIDFVYRYKGYEGKKQFLKLANALAQKRVKDAAEQLRVFAGFSKDPYDTYAYIESIVIKSRAQLMYFFLTRSDTAFDKNIAHTSYDYKKAIAHLHADAIIGLHPSYYTLEHTDWLAEEKKRLEKLSGKIIYHSRQHYLRFHLPESYTALIQSGIAYDYSMMYADRCGFRASTCKPFHFFNLKNNEATMLQIHSPVVMDTTLRYAMKLNPVEAIRLIEKLMDSVRHHSGEFISIWHNSNLSEAEGWQEWRSVFDTMHNLVAEKK